MISFCICNQVYLLNRRFVKGDFFNHQYSFWAFRSQGQTLYFTPVCVCLCILYLEVLEWLFLVMAPTWLQIEIFKKSVPVTQWFFPCKPVWILDTGVLKKEKHLSFIIWSWHQRSGKKSQNQKSVPVTYRPFSWQIHIECFLCLYQIINSWYNCFGHGINKMSQT